MKLTVIIPVYNEVNSIEKLIDLILKINFINTEIILVDDCSNDGTTELIKTKLTNKVQKTIFHEKNLGKGASIKSAQNFITGDIIIIQDADLEYDPNDYQELIKPIIDKEIKVVYGSRVLGKNKFENLENFSHAIRIWGNTILTSISNFCALKIRIPLMREVHSFPPPKILNDLIIVFWLIFYSKNNFK